MTEQPLNTGHSVSSPETKNDEVEIDLMDILRKIIAIRKTLYKAAGIGLVIGLIVALSIPKQYTVKVTLSPESGNSKGGSGLSSLAASFLGGGVSSNDGVGALNASLSTDIVSSTPFLLELFDMDVVTFNGEKQKLIAYLDNQSSPWWNAVIGLPGIMIDGVKLLFASEKKESEIPDTNQGTIELTNREAEKISFLKSNIIATMDNKTAITVISVTLQDPHVTASVADSVVKKLQKYITDYRISKAKEDCVYLEKLFKERQQEYYVAQRKYADYVDSHDNIILQSARANQERLHNDMSLAYQVYSQVANQLQVARAKVQEEKPVFAIVEPAVVPLQSSGTGFKIYVLVFMFLSVVGTIGWMLLGKHLWNTLKKEIKD